LPSAFFLIVIVAVDALAGIWLLNSHSPTTCGELACTELCWGVELAPSAAFTTAAGITIASATIAAIVFLLIIHFS
jgi:hypothetical protein